MTAADRFQRLHPALVVKASVLHGRGTIATRALSSGTLLFVMGGRLMSVVEESRRSGPLGDSGLGVADNLVLGHETEEEIGGIGYINHSCNPNAGFHGQIFLVAIRDIAADEEVTIDYAMCIGDLPSNVPDPAVYRLECACKSVDCRGWITDRDWMKPELQARYRGYFQPYLQARIDGRRLSF